jgi:hypothetical protein
MAFGIDDRAVLGSEDSMIIDNMHGGSDYLNVIRNTARERLRTFSAGYPFMIEGALSKEEALEILGTELKDDTYYLMIKHCYAFNALVFLVITDTGYKYYILSKQKINKTIYNTAKNLPVSEALLPPAASWEIAYRIVKTGETKDLKDLTNGNIVTGWVSSTPSVATVDANGIVTGSTIGSAFISINSNEYIAVVVVPPQAFYTVPESQAARLPPESELRSGLGGDVSEEAAGVSNRSGFGGENSEEAAGVSKNVLQEYITEPTVRLAYQYRNKGEHYGASGPNGGIDILARGDNYVWLPTTYHHGGWFYDLNGVKGEMIDGYQKDPRNGVELTVKPEFVYENGIPYLQLRHILFNTGNRIVGNQNFGASADVMMSNNDYASLVHKPYGAYMADSETRPVLELMLVCEGGQGITPVDTLWLGEWKGGQHLKHIYDNDRGGIHNADSAIAFSFKNITLKPKETKEFIVRFTLARRQS